MQQVHQPMAFLISTSIIPQNLKKGSKIDTYFQIKLTFFVEYSANCPENVFGVVMIPYFSPVFSLISRDFIQFFPMFNLYLLFPVPQNLMQGSGEFQKKETEITKQPFLFCSFRLVLFMSIYICFEQISLKQHLSQ